MHLVMKTFLFFVSDWKSEARDFVVVFKLVCDILLLLCCPFRIAWLQYCAGGMSQNFHFHCLKVEKPSRNPALEMLCLLVPLYFSLQSSSAHFLHASCIWSMSLLSQGPVLYIALVPFWPLFFSSAPASTTVSPPPLLFSQLYVSQLFQPYTILLASFTVYSSVPFLPSACQQHSSCFRTLFFFKKTPLFSLISCLLFFPLVACFLHTVFTEILLQSLSCSAMTHSSSAL